MFIYYNPNPEGIQTGDCVVRAICKLTGWDWDTAYIRLCIEGSLWHRFPDSNLVWSSLLYKNGFIRNRLPNLCPFCYTVREFANDHPRGAFLLALDGHVVAVENGNYYDTWDSGNEVPFFYWEKGVI